jgi:hypothetical protein
VTGSNLTGLGRKDILFIPKSIGCINGRRGGGREWLRITFRHEILNIFSIRILSLYYDDISPVSDCHAL